MPLPELFAADLATTTVTSGGRDVVESGTQETLTVASSAMFGAPVPGQSRFHVADAAPGKGSEIFDVIGVSGLTWTVIRGGDDTVPVTHDAGFTVCQVVTTGFLNSLQQWLIPSGDTTGATDTGAINGALAAAPLGGIVALQPGTWYTDLPLEIPPQVTLAGSHSSHIDATTVCIMPVAAFTGAAAILMVDQATGGYSVVSSQQQILNITVEGSNLTGSAIDGIQAQGYVHGVILQDVQIRDMPAHGIATVTNSSGNPYSWRGTRIAANTCGTHGFSVASLTDSTWIDGEAIGCGQNGWNLSGAPSNSHFIGCRAEYSGASHISGQGNGFNLSGAWGTGTGAGGCQFTNCSTDGNWGAGVAISATGDVPVVFNGLMLRRDGYGDAGAYQSGLCLDAAGIPVTVGGLSVYPGIALVSYANSPVYGVYCHGSVYFSLASGWIHAATTAISTGSNTICRISPNIGTATGTTSSPTYNYDNPWGTDSGSTYTANLDANDQTGIAVTQASTFTNTSNPLVLLTAGNSGSDILLKATYQGAAHSLVQLLCSGALSVGSGSAVVDTTLSRISAGVWQTGNAVTVAGLAGATAATRWVGATASGAPVSGTFLTGDMIIDIAGGIIRTCTAGGSPGTWT